MTIEIVELNSVLSILHFFKLFFSGSWREGEVKKIFTSTRKWMISYYWTWKASAEMLFFIFLEKHRILIVPSGSDNVQVEFVGKAGNLAKWNFCLHKETRRTAVG